MRDFGIYWKNKKEEVERVELPFQKIETINLPRSNIGTLAQFKKDSENGEWKNKLIWGDNRYVMASLLSEFRGKIKLIYADPPFFTGTNMNITIEVGDEDAVKEPSAIEEIAYRNMWKEGPSSFFQYMYERFTLMKDLLSEDGTIWVRFDYHYSHYIKGILDEVFGYDNFRNEIVVKRGKVQFGLSEKYTVATDSIFFYSKTDNYLFQKFTRERYEHEPKGTNMVLKGERNPRERTFYDETGQKHVLIPPPKTHWKFVQSKIEDMTKKGLITLKESKKGAEYGVIEIIDGEKRPSALVPHYEFDLPKTVDTNWTDISGYSNTTGYPTENSEQLLERVILSGSNPNDIVADFFSGSGTTVAVAEKLGRRWVGADIGRFSLHTIRKRLLDIPQCKPFEVLNLGKYERKHWMDQTLGSGYRNYIDFILQLYKAKPVYDYKNIHGIISGKAVHVGPIDYPVTKGEVEECLKEAKDNGFDSLDVLGWDFEMEFNDRILRELRGAYDFGISLRIIPNEVMDKRAVEAGDVDFYEHAFLEAKVITSEKKVKVNLENFIIPNPESIPEELRDKILKWSDFIDYWSVDWNYRDDTFHNEWQEFRTKKKKTLQLQSIEHHYEKPGNYKVMVKVIDVFGNDTTTIKEVTVA
jgi:adenine-specific DNA-methyltransferase